MPADVIGYLYAATVAAGGIMGFVKASSIPSLGAGVAFGVILGYGAHLNSQNPPKPLVQFGAALILTVLMGSRFINSGKIMPAGLIAILSGGALIRNVMVYNKYLPVVGDP